MKISVAICASICILQMVMAAPVNMLAKRACPPGTAPAPAPKCPPYGSQDPYCLLVAINPAYLDFFCVLAPTLQPPTVPGAPTLPVSVPAVPLSGVPLPPLPVAPLPAAPLPAAPLPAVPATLPTLPTAPEFDQALAAVAATDLSSVSLPSLSD